MWRLLAYISNDIQGQHFTPRRDVTIQPRFNYHVYGELPKYFIKSYLILRLNSHLLELTSFDRYNSSLSRHNDSHFCYKMYSQVLLAALSGAALVKAQTPTTSTVIPAVPSTTDGIPTIEGALVYDGPPVIGYTGL
jgi:hypothetical protein